MADPVIDTSFPVLPRGYDVAEPDAPERGVLGWGRDRLLDVAGAINTTARDFVGAGGGAEQAIETSPEAQAKTVEIQRFLRDTGKYINQAKTKKGQWEEERGGPKFGDGVGNTVDAMVRAAISGAPILAASAATGPAAPFVAAGGFGATGYGHTRNEILDELDRHTEDELKEKIPEYAKMREQGLSHDDAKMKLYQATNDPTSAAITFGGNVIGGGLLGHAGAKIVSKVAGRELAEALTNKIIDQNKLRNRVMTGMAEGYVGGQAMGAGSSYARQRGLNRIGMGEEPSVLKAIEEGNEPGMLMGTMAGLGRGVFGKPPAKKGAPGEKPKADAPPIGTEQEFAAAANERPAYMPPEAPPEGPEGGAQMPGGRPERGEPTPGPRPYEDGPEGPHMPTPPSDRPAYMPPERPMAEGAHMPGAPPEGAAHMPGGRPERGEPTGGPRPYEEGTEGGHMPPGYDTGPGYSPQELAEGAHMPGRAAEGPAYMPGGERRRGMAEVGARYGEDAAGGHPEGTLEHLYALRDRQDALLQHLADRTDALHAEVREREGLRPDEDVHDHIADYPDLRAEQRRIDRLTQQHDALDAQISAARRALMAQRGTAPPATRARRPRPPDEGGGPREPPPPGGGSGGGGAPATAEAPASLTVAGKAGETDPARRDWLERQLKEETDPERSAWLHRQLHGDEAPAEKPKAEKPKSAKERVKEVREKTKLGVIEGGKQQGAGYREPTKKEQDAAVATARSLKKGDVITFDNGDRWTVVKNDTRGSWIDDGDVHGKAGTITVRDEHGPMQFKHADMGRQLLDRSETASNGQRVQMSAGKIERAGGEAKPVVAASEGKATGKKAEKVKSVSKARSGRSKEEQQRDEVAEEADAALASMPKMKEKASQLHEGDAVIGKDTHVRVVAEKTADKIVFVDDYGRRTEHTHDEVDAHLQSGEFEGLSLPGLKAAREYLEEHFDRLRKEEKTASPKRKAAIGKELEKVEQMLYRAESHIESIEDTHRRIAESKLPKDQAEAKERQRLRETREGAAKQLELDDVLVDKDGNKFTVDQHTDDSIMLKTEKGNTVEHLHEEIGEKLLDGELKMSWADIKDKLAEGGEDVPGGRVTDKVEPTKVGREGEHEGVPTAANEPGAPKLQAKAGTMAAYYAKRATEVRDRIIESLSGRPVTVESKGVTRGKEASERLGTPKGPRVWTAEGLKGEGEGGATTTTGPKETGVPLPALRVRHEKAQKAVNDARNLIKRGTRSLIDQLKKIEHQKNLDRDIERQTTAKRENVVIRDTAKTKAPLTPKQIKARDKGLILRDRPGTLRDLFEDIETYPHQYAKLHGGDILKKSQALLEAERVLATKINEAAKAKALYESKLGRRVRTAEAAETPVMRETRTKADEIVEAVREKREAHAFKNTTIKKIAETITAMADTAKQLARRVKDTKRKAARRSEQRLQRENLAKLVATRAEYNLGFEFLEGFARRHPTEPMNTRPFHEFMDKINELSWPSLRDLADRLREDVAAKLEVAKDQYKKFEDEQAALGRKMEVSMNLGERAGKGPWHNRLTDYDTFIKEVDQLIGPRVDETKDPTLTEVRKWRDRGAKFTNPLRDLLTDHYVNEMLTYAGRVEEIDSFRKTQLEILQQDIARAKIATNLTREEKDTVLAVDKMVQRVITEREQDIANMTDAERADVLARNKDTRTPKKPPKQTLPGSSGKYDKVKAAPEDAPSGLGTMETPAYAGLSGMARTTKGAGLPNLSEARRIIREILPEDVREDRDRRAAAMTVIRDMIDDFKKENEVNARREAKRKGEATDLPSTVKEPTKRQIDQSKLRAKEEAENKVRARTTELTDRATKLFDAMNNVHEKLADQWTTREEIRDLHNAMRERMGEKPERGATGDTVVADLKRWGDELESIENELMGHYENVVPFAKNNEYGLRKALDSGASLRDPGNLPRGAYVFRTSDFLKPGDRFYGIRPGRDVPNNRIRNHFLGVAKELVGHVDVVAMTPEQFSLAAKKRGIPQEAPAFYDPKTDRIFITHDALRAADRGATLGHEIGHAISEGGFQQFPDVRSSLNSQRAVLKRAYDRGDGRQRRGELDADFQERMLVRNIIGSDTQGLHNVEEFFSHLWNNPAYAEALHVVETTREQREGWRTEEHYKDVPDPLGKKGATKEVFIGSRGSALESTIAAIKKGLDGQFWGVSKKRLLNDATITSMDMLRRMQAAGRVRPEMREGVEARPLLGAFAEFGKELAEGTTERAKDFYHDVWSQGGLGGIMLKMQTLDSVVRSADRGMNEATQPIYDVKARSWSHQQDIVRKQDKPVAMMMGEVFRNHTVAKNNKFLDYLQHVNYAGVSGGHALIGKKDAEGRRSDVNKHVPEDRTDLMHAYYAKEHAILERRWADLSPDQQKLAETMREYYAKRDRDVSQKMLRVMIDETEMVTGRHPEATNVLLKHFNGDKLTQPETELLAQHVPGFAGHRDASDRTAAQEEFIQRRARIRANGAYRQLTGPYYPMTRYGDWVVHAKYDVSKLAERGRELNPDETGPERTWEFDTHADGAGFIKRLREMGGGSEDDPGIKVLRAREVAYEPDPKDPSKPLTIDGKPVRAGSIYEDEQGNVIRKRAESLKQAKDVHAGDLPPIIKWQIDINPHLTEMHETRRSADTRVQELHGDHDLDVRHTAARKEPAGTYVNPAYASKAMREFISGMNKTKGYAEVPSAQRQALERMMYEVAERQMLTTSARSRYAPRRYSLGANKDALRSFETFAHNTSHTLAELEYRQETNAAVEGMNKYVRDNANKKDPGDEGYDAEVERYGTKRTQIQNEIHRRMALRSDPIMRNAFDRVANIMLKLSFLDKLGSPSFPMLNSSEPWLIAGPMMAGDGHGAAAYAALRRAYGIVGASKQWGAGLADMKKIWQAGLNGTAELHDNMQLIREKVLASDHKHKEDMVRMLDTLSEHGYLDRDAGMEMSNFHNIDAGAIERRINFMDDMVRALNAQVESVNRSVTAVAAYELARDKGMTHDAATKYAQTKVAESAGNYAAYNKAPVFNNPWLRPAAQFKMYAARITDNYVRMAVNAGRGHPAQLIYMLASQSLIAGVLGLPTEPFKAAITAAHVLGLSPYNTDDVEAIVRQGAANKLGQAGGEIFTRGIPRYLGTGLFERASHASMWSSGTLGEKPDSWWATFGHAMGGAPGGLGVDMVQGTGKMLSGARNYMNGATTLGIQEMGEGARQSFPVKLVADSLGALSDQVSPRMTKAGQPTGPTPTLGTTVSNILGVRTGPQLEQYEAGTHARRAKERYNAEKGEVVRSYVTAKSAEERARIEQNIVEEFNKGRPQDERITITTLRLARRAYEKHQSLDPSLLGITYNKHTRGFAPTKETYGF